MSRDTSLDHAPSARTSPYRHLIPIGVAVLMLSTAAHFRVPLLPEIGRELSMSAAQLGLITSMFAAGRLATDLPAGLLLERVDATALLSGSAATMIIGSVALAAAPGPVVVYAAAFALGIASAATNATGMHAFSVAVPAQRRGTALAVFSTALLGGQSFGPVIGGAIASASSWRVAEVTAGAVCLALAILLLLVWRRRYAQRQSDGGVGTQAPAGDDPVAGDPAAQPPPQRASVQAAVLAISFAMFFTFGAMPQTLIPVIGARQLDLGVATIGLALGAGGLCRLVGGFIGGIMADRISRRAALLPGLMLQALGVALVAGDGVAWWFGGIVVMSLASWSISVGATVLADLTPEGGLGPRLGSFRFVGDIGLISGPLLAGYLFDRVGRVPTVLVVTLLLLGAAAWCAISVPETRRASNP